MCIYLVDYENVKTHGLDGICKLTNNDKIYIFYSKNAENLTFGLHRRLIETNGIIFYQKVDVGTKNALDFQLSSFLGYLICENKDSSEKYYIVTKDNSFSSLVNYWSKRKVSVQIIKDVSGNVIENETTPQDELASRVETLIKDKTVATKVVHFMRQHKTKQAINNALIKEYKDGKKVSEIYKKIKPLINEDGNKKEK